MKKTIKQTVAFVLAWLFINSGLGVAAETLSVTQITDLPTVYIDLDNGVTVDEITKEVQSPATFSLVSSDFETVTQQPITIKGRGNSTWQLPKKPYQIKFQTKTDLLGMGASKKWILLANYWDKTLMRNAVMYDLANKMNNIFSVECEFVDVVINGEYRGNYLLTEKIEFGGERIDEETNLGAVLMELEQQYRHASEGCDACIITGDGVHVTLKEPEVDTAFTQTDLEVTKAQTQQMLNEVETALTEGYDSYSQIIDVQSFVDWYIQNELAKNYDAAFVTSSYCYLDAKGILHMGPVWDVDVCFGNQDVTYPSSIDNGLYYYNYRADKGAWYMALMKDPDFTAMLKERWQEIKSNGWLDQMITKIDELQQNLAASQAKDTAKWPGAMTLTHVRDQGTGIGTPYFDFQSEVNYFKDWLTKRIDYLDSQWNEDYFNADQYVPVDTLTGQDVQAGTYGDIADGIWSWNQRSSTNNQKVRSTDAFFTESLQGGSYTVQAKFFYNTKSRTQDVLALHLVGTTPDGTREVLKTTMATQVTYATSPKDAQGYADLILSFDLTDYEYPSYAIILDVYSAAGALKEITLYEPRDMKRGDVNLDGSINAADALLVLQYAVGKEPLTQLQQTVARCSKDDAIDAYDALLILQYAVEIIPSFPADATV